MRKFNKAICLFISILFLLLLTLFQIGAIGADTSGRLFDNQGGIICVSHRGDSAYYPKNSFEAILSAFEKGADMVSVSVQKTKDGVFVLCESGKLSNICSTDAQSAAELTEDEIVKLHLYDIDASVSKCTVRTLEELLKSLDNDAFLIIDNCFEYADELYGLCKKYESESRCFIRTDESAGKISDYLSSGGGKLSVIGVYKGNIVFNAQSHLKKLSEQKQPIVQYQSKNYFNVSFDKFTAKKYSCGENARALAPMYEKDLCGQRTDNAQGWDEMIDRGFSVIETNNIEALKRYVAECETERAELAKLSVKADKIDTALYSQGSVKNFEAALKKAEKSLKNGNASLGELQSNSSTLLQAMKNLTPKSGNDVQKGTLNITPGKIIAAVVFGLLILAGEIYVYKMQKPKIKGRH